MTKISFFYLFIIFFTVLLFQSCGDDDKRGNGVSIAFFVEPKTLNPILGAGSALDRQVFTHHIFSLLTEADPNTGIFTPCLAKTMPVVKNITEGENAGGVSYTYEILDEAVWDNGTPITGNDYVFSMKTILHPKVENLYKTYYSFIKDIQVDAANPKKFTIIAKKSYILAENALSSVPVMPDYVYDPNGALKNIPLTDFIDVKKIEALSANPSLDAFSKDFMTAYGRDKGKISGSGPYQFEDWVTGSKIVLSKKKNHWTEKFAGQRFGLTAYPEQIEYKIYSNPAAAVNDLKNKSVDIFAQVPATDFYKLQEDAEMNKEYNFFTPTTNYAGVLNLNTKNPKLADVKVRKAISHLVNVQEIIKTFYNGKALPIKSIVSPQKDYYAAELPEISYNIEEAKKLLTEAGWKDSNNNGSVDKSLKGKLTELNLTYLVVNKSPAPEIAQIIQNAAKQAGVTIQIDAKEMKLFKEDTKKKAYEMFYLLGSQDEDIDDFSQKWGTKSMDNATGFGTAESDKLIEKINTTLDKKQRDVMYHEFQKIVADNCPTIPMVSPTDRVMISKRYPTAKTIKIRPFYQEHTFKK